MARQRVGAEALLPAAGVGAWERACHAGAGRPSAAGSSLGGRGPAQAGVPVDLAVATVVSATFWSLTEASSRLCRRLTDQLFDAHPLLTCIQGS